MPPRLLHLTSDAGLSDPQPSHHVPTAPRIARNKLISYVRIALERPWTLFLLQLKMGHNDIACSCLQKAYQKHADTEAGIATPVYTCNRHHPSSSTTSVDVLQVCGGPHGAVSWSENLDHDDMMHLFEVHSPSLSVWAFQPLVILSSIKMVSYRRPTGHR